jgi:mRNA interferase MazF
MPISRGDLVIVAAPGDCGKARPAVIVQSNAMPASHASVVICPLTSELVEVDFRITIEPGRKRGCGFGFR